MHIGRSELNQGPTWSQDHLNQASQIEWGCRDQQDVPAPRATPIGVTQVPSCETLEVLVLGSRVKWRLGCLAAWALRIDATPHGKPPGRQCTRRSCICWQTSLLLSCPANLCTWKCTVARPGGGALCQGASRPVWWSEVGLAGWMDSAISRRNRQAVCCFLGLDRSQESLLSCHHSAANPPIHLPVIMCSIHGPTGHAWFLFATHQVAQAYGRVHLKSILVLNLSSPVPTLPGSCLIQCNVSFAEFSAKLCKAF